MAGPDVGKTDDQLPEAGPEVVDERADPRVVPEVSAAVREHGLTLGLTAADFRRQKPPKDTERRSTFGE